MPVDKHQAKLADSTQYPQLGEAQAAIANANTGSPTAADCAAQLNLVLAALRYHGLIKES